MRVAKSDGSMNKAQRETMMTRQRPTKVDPIEQEIELALNPGAFIPDGACFSFVSDLDEVVAKMAKLTATDPSRAVALYKARWSDRQQRVR